MSVPGEPTPRGCSLVSALPLTLLVGGGAVGFWMGGWAGSGIGVALVGVLAGLLYAFAR